MVSSHIHDMPTLPDDPVRRLTEITQLRIEANRYYDALLGAAYFDARIQGRVPDALRAGPWATYKAIAATRAVNRRRGRQVTWKDGWHTTPYPALDDVDSGIAS